MLVTTVYTKRSETNDLREASRMQLRKEEMRDDKSTTLSWRTGRPWSLGLYSGS